MQKDKESLAASRVFKTKTDAKLANHTEYHIAG